MDRTPYEGGNGAASLKAKRGGLGSTRRTSTPYQRPSSGRHASDGRAALAKSGSWVASGIVDSASRMLTKGAAYFFTSLFKRQAPAIAASAHWGPKPGEETAAIVEDIPPLELVPEENAAVISDRVEESRADQLLQEDNDDVQMENILKQSHLTREQCERYISLLKSKLPASDPSFDGLDNSRLVAYGENSSDLLATASQADAHVRSSQPDLVPYKPARAPWERNEKHSEPQIQRPVRSFSSRWTPLQTPITGGRELLKRRVPLTNDSGPSRRVKDNSIHSGAGMRKLQEEVDLSCFRKESKTPLGTLPVPKQSTRTAQKIMDTLNKTSLKSRSLVRRTFAEAKGTRFSKTASTSPLTDTRNRLAMPPTSKEKAPEENVMNGEASSWRDNTVKSVRFSFPSAAGPEPPTPKAMPTPISGNGPLVAPWSSEASPSLSNGTSSSTPNGPSVATSRDEDMSNLVARAEKVTSLLSRATTSQTLTKTTTTISNDTSGKTSYEHTKPKVGATANGFWSSHTFAAATGDPSPSDQGPAAKNPFLDASFGAVKVSTPSFFVDGQSLAAPETSNNPFAAPALTMTKSLGNMDKSKKKLSTKRLR